MNNKLNSWWNPDLRPENIEDYEETYTFTNGTGEEQTQTETYKFIKLPIIINKVLSKVAFIWTHAGCVWYNRLANRTVKDELDALNAKSKIVMGENFEPVTYPFFVPEDGHLYVQVTGDPAYLYLNSEKFNFSAAPYRHYFALYIRGNSVLAQFCPVKKGDTISAAGRSGQTYSCFIPKS